jgi:hypothetical protein
MEKFELDYKLKRVNGVYNPDRWNAKDANEVKIKFEAFALAVLEALAEKDKQIEALTEQVARHERQIGLGLVEAGFVQPDYLQP